jgi:hypothetical protein
MTANGDPQYETTFKYAVLRFNTFSNATSSPFKVDATVRQTVLEITLVINSN